jgi:FlgD Ig-like domain
MKSYKITKLCKAHLFNVNLVGKTLIALILISTLTFAQNTQITWYSFTSGFGETGSANTKLKSIIGDPIVGNSANAGSSISSGFFSNPVSTGILTGIDKQSGSSIPASYQLNQNYPNPFNPSTNIKFSLPEQSTVKIVIYDLLGRKVKTLINDVRPAGIFTVQWNGDNESNINVSSGIYFYSLYALGSDNKKYTSFKKMILLK